MGNLKNIIIWTENSIDIGDRCGIIGRMNANALVAAIILMQRNNWTTEALFDRVDFDLLTRTALGLDTLDETPFCPATFFRPQTS